MDFPVVRAKSTWSSHVTLTRSLGQLVFCVDTERCTCGTLVDKERIIPDREKRSDGGCFLFLPAAQCFWMTGFLALQPAHRALQLTSVKPIWPEEVKLWVNLPWEPFAFKHPWCLFFNSKPASLFCFVRRFQLPGIFPVLSPSSQVWPLSFTKLKLTMENAIVGSWRSARWATSPDVAPSALYRGQHYWWGRSKIAKAPHTHRSHHPQVSFITGRPARGSRETCLSFNLWSPTMPQYWSSQRSAVQMTLGAMLYENHTRVSGCWAELFWIRLKTVAVLTYQNVLKDQRQSFPGEPSKPTPSMDWSPERQWAQSRVDRYRWKRHLGCQKLILLGQVPGSSCLESFQLIKRVQVQKQSKVLFFDDQMEKCKLELKSTCFFKTAVGRAAL